MLKKTVQDSAYVAVGLGVLGFQRAQVRRQELLKQIRSQREETRSQLGRVAREVEIRVEPVLKGIEQRVDPVLDDLQERLPSPARGLVQQARQAAKDARGRLVPALA